MALPYTLLNITRVIWRDFETPPNQTIISFILRVGDGCLDHNKWETHFASLIGASFFVFWSFQTKFVKCIFRNEVLFSSKEKAFSPRRKECWKFDYGFFFFINFSLIISTNRECKIILDIYVSRAFHQYKEHLKTKLHFFPREEVSKLPKRSISLKEQIPTCLTKKYKNKWCPNLSSPRRR